MNVFSTFLRFAHLSDLHFFASEWNTSLFSSHRGRSFFAQLHTILPFSVRKQDPNHAKTLSNFLKNQDEPLDFIFVSGDLTTKGSQKECDLALDWLKETDPIPKLVLPGNHDVFQRKENHFPFKKLLLANGFDFYIEEFLEEGCTSVTLPKGWSLILLDLTHTQIGHAQGLFSEKIEEKLKKKLDEIKGPCLVAGHFPLFERRTSFNVLLRHKNLLDCLLHYPQVKVYLHGHTHELHHRIWTDKKRDLLSLDSGCSLIGEKPTWGIYSLIKEQIDLKWFQMEQGIPSELGSFTKKLRVFVLPSTDLSF